MRVEVVAWNPLWHSQFLEERERIAGALGNRLVALEHIGSTAVPGLAAKPIIDIQVAVADLAAFDRSCAADGLVQLGYVHRTDLQELVPFRRFFQRLTDSDGPKAHIHLVQQGHPWWERHLLFRDYLRTREDARLRYEAMKLELASKEWPSMREYAEAKTELVLALEEEAFEHFSLNDAARARVRAGRIA